MPLSFVAHPAEQAPGPHEPPWSGHGGHSVGPSSPRGLPVPRAAVVIPVLTNGHLDTEPTNYSNLYGTHRALLAASTPLTSSRTSQRHPYRMPRPTQDKAFRPCHDPVNTIALRLTAAPVLSTEIKEAATTGKKQSTTAHACPQCLLVHGRTRHRSIRPYPKTAV